MNILGEFPVQNQQDAAYWIAVVTFLRAATKMFFGKDDAYGLKGNPPPILHLNGYGDHMFNNIPVIIQTFNLELRQGIDYISTTQDSVYGKGKNPSNPGDRTFAGNPHLEGITDANAIDQTWAPTLSTISVQIIPAYSRDTVKKFSMKDFVNGDLTGGEHGIGFM